MSDFTEKVRAMLDGRDRQGWHKDPLNRISVIRKCTGNETPGVHDLICQCNGQSKDIALSNVDFIAAAPTLLREAVERIEKLEKVAEAARGIRFDGPNVYGAMEVSSGKGTVTSLQDALSALDAADTEGK